MNNINKETLNIFNKEEVANSPENAILKNEALCDECIHKEICENLYQDNSEYYKIIDNCEYYKPKINLEKYNSIYQLFEPISNWLKIHYPNGDANFLVTDKSKFYLLNKEPSPLIIEFKE